MNYPLWVKRIRCGFVRFSIGLRGRLPHPHVAKGEKFIAVRPLPARGLVQWRAPLTSGFECVIPKGTVLVAEHDSAPISTGFSCVPVNHAELESQLVPKEDRTAEKYTGYYFVLPYRHIGKELQRFERVPPNKSLQPTP